MGAGPSPEAQPLLLAQKTSRTPSPPLPSCLAQAERHLRSSWPAVEPHPQEQVTGPGLAGHSWTKDSPRPKSQNSESQSGPLRRGDSGMGLEGTRRVGGLLGRLGDRSLATSPDLGGSPGRAGCRTVHRGSAMVTVRRGFVLTGCAKHQKCGTASSEPLLPS